MQRWYAPVTARFVTGSLGAEFWASWNTFFISMYVLFKPLPAGSRGLVLDTIGTQNQPVFLLFLVLVTFVHFVFLWIRNYQAIILYRKLALAIEMACWSSVFYDFWRGGQNGSLFGLGMLLFLMAVGIARRKYSAL